VLTDESGRDSSATFVERRVSFDARIDDMEISEVEAVQLLGYSEDFSTNKAYRLTWH
jgi:hypothetical protein